ncbi:hypothetical protein [Shewanella aquimarina]|uniref:hypothetical protein n=1 Tax=Shewanella aquimarina TaxID=260365 RepID=UPI002014D9F9|nr:hypothetical protein [Shewanella aquimarina]MCL2909017.1 hypothetical protein [Shewanella aquimarina]
MTQFGFLPVCLCGGIVCADSPNYILLYAHGLSHRSKQFEMKDMGFMTQFGFFFELTTQFYLLKTRKGKE